MTTAEPTQFSLVNRALLTTILLFSSVCSFLTAFSAHAYIPHSQTIVGRLVRNSGRGSYTIEQEVQFRTAGEPLTLRERWVIENGETMRLTVSGPQVKNAEPIRYEANYTGGRRTAPDLTTSTTMNQTKTTALSSEFVEGLFHSRSSGGFFTALNRARILQPGQLRERPRITKIDTAKYPPEPYVRLGRTAGVVTWIFGDATPAQAQRLSPAAWIEQDAFQLRRVRFPSEAEVSADRFTSYPNSLRFPRERTVTWGNNSVLIRVLSVKQGATSARETAKGTHLPDIAQVKEFYSRFR